MFMKKFVVNWFSLILKKLFFLLFYLYSSYTLKIVKLCGGESNGILIGAFISSYIPLGGFL